MYNNFYYLPSNHVKPVSRSAGPRRAVPGTGGPDREDGPDRVRTGRTGYGRARASIFLVYPGPGLGQDQSRPAPLDPVKGSKSRELSWRRIEQPECIGKHRT